VLSILVQTPVAEFKVTSAAVRVGGRKS